MIRKSMIKFYEFIDYKNLWHSKRDSTASDRTKSKTHSYYNLILVC